MCVSTEQVFLERILLHMKKLPWHRAEISHGCAQLNGDGEIIKGRYEAPDSNMQIHSQAGSESFRDCAKNANCQKFYVD